jgi:AraC-like DNA-binding protein
VNPLEHLLSTLSVNWAVATPLHAGGRWALHFAGRLDVIAGKRPYRIAGDPDTPSVFAAPYYEHEDGRPRDTAQAGEGHDTTLLGAGFTCDPEAARLLGVLPPVIHVQAGTAEATIALIRSEIHGGNRMILDRLCQVLLLQVLRDHSSNVIAHPRLGPALKAMHDDLAHPWTVSELAGVAAMSRSTFFLRFKDSVGVTPLDYLFRLRMHQAARTLRDTTRTVASIAAAAGYSTESAFSAAFKRFAGRSPGEYRTAR